MYLSSCAEKQGRDCPQCLNATRAALGLAPLHQADGGHYFHDGIATPMDDSPQNEPDDCRPIPSAEQVESWPVRLLAALAVIAALVGVLWPLWAR